MSENILVIKLGALGDFIQAAASFAATRTHHHRSRITLLTTSPFAEFAVKSQWFDDVWVDQRPKSYDLAGWLGLRSRLRRGGFTVFMISKPPAGRAVILGFFGRIRRPIGRVSRGAVPFRMTTQRAISCIRSSARRSSLQWLVFRPGCPRLSWVRGDISRFNFQERFDSGARWRTTSTCQTLARWISSCLGDGIGGDGSQPVVVGSARELSLGEEVLAGCDIGHNLAGQTNLEDLFLLARDADSAVGNDTGPMHVFAAQGCRTLVLYSSASNPALCAQRGDTVTILRREDLQDLSVTDVAIALSAVNSGASS